MLSILIWIAVFSLCFSAGLTTLGWIIALFPLIWFCVIMLLVVIWSLDGGH